jgi:hypothetical protein
MAQYVKKLRVVKDERKDDDLREKDLAVGQTILAEEGDDSDDGSPGSYDREVVDEFMGASDGDSDEDL